ncbi:MAG TPA: transcription termination factor NusA [Candidatus Omnitrophota bacterium]|jgi:N utilization substance protein A|nr:transcription termination factor NusA [Candidatus Omnitrophota bacterium]HQB93636.1 transcription termination factor NusA [Candidatus Omnitrophota bacterium]
MSQDLAASIEYIEKEKGVSRQVLVEALQHALLSACRKSFPEKGDLFEIQINPNTLQIKVLSEGKEIDDPRFGRIAAQTAKQVIIQKLREAERDSIFSEYSHKQGDIVSGSVHRIEKKAIIVDFGKTEGILPAREQSPVDSFRQGHVIRAYVMEVKKTSKGPEVILSRTHPELVSRFFEMEVPEIHDKVVEIKGIAREAGSRAKIAVTSRDEKIDCVGSCVGVRGQRVKNIVRELNGEKIDIIRYSEDIETYIRNAMAPAELLEIKLNRDKKRAEILVADDQLSLAIGKRGQNVRLASKLIGWDLDVRSKSQMIPLTELEGVDEKIEEALKKAGMNTVKDVTRVKPEDLAKIEGLNEETAGKLLASAKQMLAPRGAQASAANESGAEEAES